MVCRHPGLAALCAIFERLMQATLQAAGLLEEMHDHESSFLFWHIGKHIADGGLLCLFYLYHKISSWHILTYVV
jgi:hypothetical protein